MQTSYAMYSLFSGTFLWEQMQASNRQWRITRARPLLTVSAATTMAAAGPRDFIFLCKNYVAHC